jgi:SAM-dependent methyltransferase
MMPVKSSYGDYASGEYLEYQSRYASTIRESDRRLIEMIRDAAGKDLERGLRLVDIGCSSGNFLLHLKHHLPGLRLTGGDAFPGIPEKCRANPDLAGIEFEMMDLLDLQGEGRFDIVVVNAVLFLFDQPEFERAVAGIARLLASGGRFFAFDLCHPYEQELAILEKSKTHPEGMTLHFRPYSVVEATLRRHGFAAPAVTPFAIPIDLPRPADMADISSQTVRTEGGDRLIFRGALYTPWCHLAARKET